MFPEFWTGRTGNELRKLGGKDAQLLGLYLVTSRHANLLGLYRLTINDVRHETGLGLKAIERGYAAAAESGFAQFDAATNFVWVLNMARFRLGMKAGDALDSKDHKVVVVNRIYHALDSNPFLGEFFDVNGRILRIRKRRASVGLVVPFEDVHQMSGLPRGLEAPTKPDPDTETEADPDTDVREEGAPTARPSDPSGVRIQHQRRRVAPDGRAKRAASAPVDEALLKKHGFA